MVSTIPSAANPLAPRTARRTRLETLCYLGRVPPSRAGWALVLLLVVASGCQHEAVRLPPGAPIVLIVVDTLRADGLGFYGYPRATSPRLDAWAERGAVFERAFSASPWTLPSFGSLYTGRYPSHHGSGRGQRTVEGGRPRRFFAGLDPSVPTLAELLSTTERPSAAFVTNSFLRPTFGMAAGFQTYDFARNRMLFERHADALVDRALEWIDRQAGGSWLLLLHVLEPHLPYDPAPEVAGRFTSGYAGSLALPIGVESNLVRQVKRGEIVLDQSDRAFLRGAYDEEVAFVDAHLGRFLDQLESRGVLERGLVLFTADHGEEFLDHGALEHGHTMFQEQLHVPLVMWGHGVRPGRHREPVSLVDVVPTVLDAVGQPTPAGIDGSSLWPVVTGGRARAPRALFAQNSLYGDQRQAVIDWPYKLIVNLDHPRRELYDLDADPGEHRDVSSLHPELVDRLEASLPQRSKAAVAGEEVDLDAESRRELEALGYLR
jgi:choline-sulfatase